MRIIQFAVILDSDNNETMYALGDDGTLYEKLYVVGDPMPTPEKPYARDFAYYWNPCAIEVGMPERFKVKAND
jgi:hypothetical protein